MIKLLLGVFFSESSGPIAKRVLAALGMGIVSSVGVLEALSAVIASAQSHYSGIGADILGLAGLAGIGNCFGIITGAIVFRLTINSFSKLAILPK